MNTKGGQALVNMRTVEKNFYYMGTQVLTVEIEYPIVYRTGNSKAEAMINNRIKSQVNAFFAYTKNQLYKQAIQEYKDAQQNGYPFREFSAVLSYSVTYNNNCHFSVFRDQFQYTGGAHGTTERFSDTWDFRRCRLLTMSDFFRTGVDYKSVVLTEAIRQADINQKQQEIYFENYPELMRQNFNPRSFYLTEDGMVIYYQQYEIAPYSTGIPTFTIPYSCLSYPPTCYTCP